MPIKHYEPYRVYVNKDGETEILMQEWTHVGSATFDSVFVGVDLGSPEGDVTVIITRVGNEYTQQQTRVQDTRSSET
jgi:hypothetical protein